MTIIVLAGELMFALALSLTLGTFSLISLLEQRGHAMRRVAATIATTLMPLVADQQYTRAYLQLESIAQSADIRDIECICLVDGAGISVVHYPEDATCLLEPASVSTNLVYAFTESQAMRQPITVDGREVATVFVRFEPLSLAEALRAPAFATGLVLVSVMLVSTPWTLWALRRYVAEPLEELEKGAARIAQGEYDVEHETEGVGEIGSLQLSLAEMARQLDSRDTELREAMSSLELAKRQVEELAAMKSDFVAIAAHEIRTPLSAIMLYSERLEAQEITELDEAGLDAAAAIHAAASRLTSISSDLLDAALIERGLMPLRCDDVWLDEVVQEAVRDARMPASTRDQTVSLRDEEIPETMVRGDALRLRQVLDNLLSNAIKYSPVSSTMIVDVRIEPGWVCIDVIDRGAGVPEEEKAHLFKLFGRLDFGDSRQAAGLGLGLAISARIAQAHGGTVEVSPGEDGIGSIFTLRLPEYGTYEPRVTSFEVRGEAAGGQ